MDFDPSIEELSNDLLFVVCARCGEEKPESHFTAKRQSAGPTKQCIDCRKQRVAHIQTHAPDAAEHRCSSILTRENRREENRWRCWPVAY
ncbi:hypothetical protein BGZ61DRAFT_460882 [Ilyonectria robusta]|uniref:uncharacterized protein n=1 Tax=Ilyonectria robusta TaxID=1079257 RepID=UPI001E8D337C|nr:uncharacterized protein BGZ61DRAFT_460882 [Ilyonectria robusta]KAH8669327.1 hypothetical protein BGZ61DRAFT_460882 [Ilyonectria robusta]